MIDKNEYDFSVVEVPFIGNSAVRIIRNVRHIGDLPVLIKQEKKDEKTDPKRHTI